MKRWSTVLVLAGLLGGCVSTTDHSTHQVDVIIYGGTSAGIAAAVQAVRMDLSVIVVSPDIGGCHPIRRKYHRKRKKGRTIEKLQSGLYLQGVQICSRIATLAVSASKHPTLTASFGWNG
jgi:malic enzyme